MNANVRPIENEFIELDLSAVKKKKLRFDKDDRRVVEVDIADVTVLSRIKEAIPKLEALQETALSVTEDVSVTEDSSTEQAFDAVDIITSKIKEIDFKMREILDEIFQAPVSAAAVPTGTMCDIFNGSFRYIYVMSTLMSRYTDSITREYKKIDQQINTHTVKYTKGKK